MNENPLILPCTLSIVGGFSFVEEMCGKKNASSAFRLALIYILSFMSHCAKSMKISEYLLCIDPVGGNWRTSR